MKVCVIGTGYVGLVSGVCFSDFGVDVTCVDNDKEKVESLKAGVIPIFEPGLKEILDKNVAQGRLAFTTDVADAIQSASIVFIAVGTPPNKDGSSDLTFVEEVARTIAFNLNDYKVIVTKSTVPVGTGRRIEKIIEDSAPEGAEFDVASNPEFLREGSAIEDFMRPNRVVIGAGAGRAVELLKELYRPLSLAETPFVIADIETAELIKHVSNAYLATKISFINEVANICDEVGADVSLVSKAMGLDKRIGPKFLHPGPGFGGSCLPKDSLSISSVARDLGYEFKIVDAVLKVNELQRERMIGKIEALVGGVKGKTLAVLGLTFKPNTDDLRESPAIYIIELLLKKGAKIRSYDPEGISGARKILKGDVEFCTDAYDAADGADCVVLATEWNEFRKLDLLRLKGLLTSPKFADLRNVYKPMEMGGAGFEYVSVGRHLS